MGATIDLSVAIVGAGFGGLGMGAALRKEGAGRFVILEEADDVGGVWRENTYPGCRCDVPSHLYSFSSDPYRNARTRYPGQQEILQYLRDFATEQGLRPHLRFRSRVTDAAFDESTGRWTLAVEGGDQVVADAVVFAVGQLHRPYIPDFPGRNDFAGSAFHSAEWDHALSLSGLDVAVVGTGASAVQIVPEIVSAARAVTVYQRSAHWVLPKPANTFGTLSQWAFHVPGAHAAYRWALSFGADHVLAPLMHRGWPSRPAELLGRTHLRRQIIDRALRARLTPDHPIGAKRILFSNTFYPALTKDNTEVVAEPITRVTRHGIDTADGRHRGADVLIFATGFKAPEFLMPMRVRGRRGLLLHDVWAQGAEAFLGLAVRGFPNLFLLAGPNTFNSAGSNPAMKEAQIRYIIRCLHWLNESGAAAIEVGAVSDARYRTWLQQALARTVWPAAHTSWYKHPSGKVTNPWPGTQRQFERMTRGNPARDFIAIPRTGHSDGSAHTTRTPMPCDQRRRIRQLRNAPIGRRTRR